LIGGRWAQRRMHDDLDDYTWSKGSLWMIHASGALLQELWTAGSDTTASQNIRRRRKDHPKSDLEFPTPATARASRRKFHHKPSRIFSLFLPHNPHPKVQRRVRRNHGGPSTGKTCASTLLRMTCHSNHFLVRIVWRSWCLRKPHKLLLSGRHRRLRELLLRLRVRTRGSDPHRPLHHRRHKNSWTSDVRKQKWPAGAHVNNGPGIATSEKYTARQSQG
jgi:hypothetical protein